MSNPTVGFTRSVSPAKAGVHGLAILLLAFPALADTDLGAQLPENARKVAEHRYRSPTDFEGTMKFYKNTYPAQNYPRRAIVNQPDVKAVHLSNPSGKGGWEGLNIYVVNDEVRISVVPADKNGSTPSQK